MVNTWKSDCQPGLSAYLLENGHLLRTGQVENRPFFGGGSGGRIQEFTWDGKLVWDFTYVNDTQLAQSRHLPGCPTATCWSTSGKRRASKKPSPPGAGRRRWARAASERRHPRSPADGGEDWQGGSGNGTCGITWIQEFDDRKWNDADVGLDPELIDLNFGDSTIAAIVARPEELDKLRSIGYVGGAGRKPQIPQPDWPHINAVAYNAEVIRSCSARP